MSLDAQAHPLYWPERWPRTAQRERTSRYKVSFADARDDVMRSLAMLGASARIISTNIPIRNDGLPRADITPQDPGVAVYWTARGRDCVIACDRWTTVRDNMRACGLALEAIRAIERSGATQVMDKVFTGFSALPADTRPRWRELLGFAEQARPNATELRAAYELRAARNHPDVQGGSHEKMVALNDAYTRGREELGL